MLELARNRSEKRGESCWSVARKKKKAKSKKKPKSAMQEELERDARRDHYDGWHDRRWYGRGNRHYRDRYRDRYWWDGRRWRSRW